MNGQANPRSLMLQLRALLERDLYKGSEVKFQSNIIGVARDVTCLNRSTCPSNFDLCTLLLSYLLTKLQDGHGRSYSE